MTHRFHPDPQRDDPPDAILWDDCEDCAARATLRGLDRANTIRAFRLMMAAEAAQGDGRNFYLTDNERELCTRLSAAYLLFNQADLLDRLKVEFVIHPRGGETT